MPLCDTLVRRHKMAAMRWPHTQQRQGPVAAQHGEPGGPAVLQGVEAGPGVSIA